MPPNVAQLVDQCKPAPHYLWCFRVSIYHTFSLKNSVFSTPMQFVQFVSFLIQVCSYYMDVTVVSHDFQRTAQTKWARGYHLPMMPFRLVTSTQYFFPYISRKKVKQLQFQLIPVILHTPASIEEHLYVNLVWSIVQGRGMHRAFFAYFPIVLRNFFFLEFSETQFLAHFFAIFCALFLHIFLTYFSI